MANKRAAGFTENELHSLRKVWPVDFLCQEQDPSGADFKALKKLIDYSHRESKTKFIEEMLLKL
jgi:hypothetical protein